MENKNKNVTPFALLGMLLMIFGVYSSTMNHALAIDFVDISLGTFVPSSSSHSQGDTYFDVSAGRAERWVAEGGSIKVINMRTNSLATTITISGGGVTDVKCGNTHCYAWSSTANPFKLWKFSATTTGGLYSMVGNLTGSDGNEGGRGIEVIDVVTGGIGSVTIALPISNTDCDGLGGGADVIAFIDGNLVTNTYLGTTAQQFNDACASIITVGDFINSMAWSGQVQQVVGDNRNTLAVRLLNAVIDNLVIYNLPTQAQICNADITNGDNWIIADDGVYWTSNSVASGDISGFNIATSGAQDCVADITISGTTNQPFGLSVDGNNDRIFISYTDSGLTDSYISARNLTTPATELFRLDMPNDVTGNVYYYFTDDEVFGVSNANDIMRVYLLGNPQTEPTTTTTEICYIVEGSGQQFCKTYDVDENGNIILDSVIGGVNPRNITTTSGELFCSLGITDCANPDITTNGTGMFMLLILVIVSYALVVAIHHFAHAPLAQIHPLLVLLIGIIDISIAFFLGWIPDFIFYSVIVLLVGLGGFGLYRIIRGV